MGSCGFSVDVKSSEVIVAILPLQKYWLPLSNLDLLLPPLDVGVFLCYNKPNSELADANQSEYSKHDIVVEIKKALAQVLVSFYPFAGEIVANIHGEPEIFCNNRGVDFVHAYYDAGLKAIDLHHPDISVHGKLLPFKKHGVLAVQVTELKCGGLVVGCTFDHRVADAYSANIFLTRWSQLITTTTAAAVTKTTSKTHSPPSFRRSLLNPRHPPCHDSFIDEMYVKISSSMQEPGPHIDNNKLISHVYYIESEQINRLQSLASYNGCKRTKLESFSAFLWKTIAYGEGNCNEIKLGIVVDGRQRLKSTEEEGEGECMGNYFGNVLSIPHKQASVSQLKNMQLKNVANMVHECIKSAANQEHFLDLIDWVELQRPEPAMVKIYRNDNVDEEAIVVSSGLRFPAAGMDFGMGKPCFGCYHFPWGGQTGYVMPMPSLNREGDWVVYMHLLRKHLDVIDKNAADVFMPYSSTHLF